MADELVFSWEGASHPEGPWSHLLVASFRGTEAISELYRYEIELLRHDDAPDVDIDDLIGAAAALRIETRTEPSRRLVHGVISAAEELGEVEGGTRYRVVLSPPLVRATMMRKSLIHLGKTLKDIVSATLERASLGAGLSLTQTSGPLTADPEDDAYHTPKLTYVWRILDERRLTDPDARPYCVQYDESDFAFVSRLLEEEGVSYHFEHAADECLLVLTDFDGGRPRIEASAPLGPRITGREIVEWRAGRRLRPRSVWLDAFNWQNPNLGLSAVGPAGFSNFLDVHNPQRYEHSKATGEILAEKREQRLDTERQHASAEGRCRLLGAGTLFHLEHTRTKFSGDYLVTHIVHSGGQGSWSGGRGALADGEVAYRQELECVRCGTAEAAGESNFRPALRTRKPRIYGSQTAIVTADPSSPDAEIHVGGEHNLGCVRLRFHWDEERVRHESEPTSCWVRVSQLFAGAGHGAMWHPRVGNEVIVEHLDGDPDRPLVTGRVYNGVNPAPEDATARPTFSCIKSLTSPHDGNYNMLAFDDLQGSEELILHAARDFTTNVLRESNRSVASHDNVHVKGDQTIQVDGSQSTVVLGPISRFSNASIADHAPTINIKAFDTLVAEAGSLASVTAPTVQVKGGMIFENADSLLTMVAGGQATLDGAAMVVITSGGQVKVSAPLVQVEGSGLVKIDGGQVNVNGGAVAVKGGVIHLDGGVTNIKGGSVNLNC